jgi:hypothetical protein
MRTINSLTFTAALFLSLIFIQSEMNAQTNSKYWKQYHYFIGFGAGPSQTKITNQSADNMYQPEAMNNSSFSISFETGYFFTKYFGVTTGIGFSPYKTVLSLDNYSNSFDTIDSEGELYERRITGGQIKEIQKISFIEIPVMICLNYPYSRIIGLYLQTGINMSIPITNSYSSSGIFTYSGYYPQYNVLLTDLPYEGFVSKVNSDAKGSLSIKKLNTQALAIGGFYFYPDKQVQISVGFFYKRMLTDISVNPSLESMQLSTTEGQIKSLMEGCSRATASSAGVMVSLRYFIR